MKLYLFGLFTILYFMGAVLINRPASESISAEDDQVSIIETVSKNSYQ